ncbi:MAG: EAL domain-containing protein [Gammaproteobacteria bacterium]|nr:MAG: EAL domain-containing protein [Gammaproteobacteria bacterium]
MRRLATKLTRFPLSLLLAGGALLAGLGLGGAFEQYQRPRLQETFEQQLLARQRHTLEVAETLFHSHVRMLQRLLRVSAARTAVREALRRPRGATGSGRFPAWMPPIDYWRGLMFPDCFVLIGGGGADVRTVLLDPAERCPRTGFATTGRRDHVRLFNPTPDEAWLLVDVPVAPGTMESPARLGLGVHLDAAFLQTLLGEVLPPEAALVLVTDPGDGTRVVASTHLDITPGTALARPPNRYLASPPDFLDEGAWDDIIGFSVWLRRDALGTLQQDVLEIAAQQRLVMALSYSLLLLLLAAWLGRRVSQMRAAIRAFSRSLGLEPERQPMRNVITLAGMELERLFEGVHSTLNARALAQQVELGRRQNELLESMAGQLGIGLLAVPATPEALAEPLNPTMRQYLAELPADAAATLVRAGEGPVILRDNQAERRVFELIPLRGVQVEERNVLLVRDVTTSYRQQEQLRHLATRDALTGLPNRQLLHDRVRMLISSAERHGHHFGLLLFDINDFKSINDHFGHSVGDQALVQVAQAVSGQLRQQDTLARLGGDEFVIVLPDTDPDGARRLAHKLLAYQKHHPFRIGETPYELSFSIGGCHWPGCGRDLEELLSNADIAMYHAKRHRLGYAAFTPEMRQGDARRLQFLTCLREALDAETIDLVYQPQLDAVTGDIHGWEALARWRHPDLGEIPPSEFIPLAEQAGLIGDLTRLVTRRAVRDCAAWRRAGIAGGVAINLSTLDFRDDRLIAIIDDAIAQASLEPPLVTLEITESLLMEEPMAAARLLNTLDEAGYWTAIDDFGTGYSSLAYLQHLPVHELKIDRTFIAAAEKDTASRRIVESLLALADSLHLNVVAEGVEDHETAQWLARQGCEYLQGYWIARPMPLAQVLEWKPPSSQSLQAR